MLMFILGCDPGPPPIAQRWHADRAGTTAEIQAMPSTERALAVHAIARALPGQSQEVCVLAPDEPTRADCDRINNRPHLRQSLRELPTASEKARAAPGPGSDRLPVPPPVTVPWRAASAPECPTEACLAATARERAARADWPGVLGACSALREEKWEQDCFFQSAEHAVRSRGPSAYTAASQLCHLATAFRAQCQGHLVNELSHRPADAIPAISEAWKEYPQFLNNLLDLYWSEHAMSRFHGTAEASDAPEADRYYRMERALGRVKNAEVRALWPDDEPGEDQIPAMRVRAVGRRAWSTDPAVDERICALEAAAAAATPSRDRLGEGLLDPEPVVRWTAARLLSHFDPSSPLLVRAASDTDARVVARARRSEVVNRRRADAEAQQTPGSR